MIGAWRSEGRSFGFTRQDTRRDKVGGKGARRFVPQLGLRGAQKQEIYPYEHGDLWTRIPLSSADLQMYTDTGKKERVSFVFKEQIAMIAGAYSALEVAPD